MVYLETMVEDPPEETLDQSAGGPRAPILRRGVELRWQDEGGMHAQLVTTRAVLGSAASSVHLQVRDPMVSRLHAELEIKAGGLWVKDLDSRNGTFVDGVQISCARVKHGGILQVGRSMITVRYDVAPQAVELSPHPYFHGLLGNSLVMRELFAMLQRVASTESTVLIEGETGTGKELVAASIHRASGRQSGPFKIVDCGRTSESFIEADLFGHTRGAFTGADRARAGVFEESDGGTVFLDEIGELPLGLQTQLLRVLESRTVRPIGSSAQARVNVRVIAATQRNLREMVNSGSFREDLYFRLAVLPILVPPLRERRDDILLLIRHLRGTAPALDFSPDEVSAIVSHPWLGNVRELRNFVERVPIFGVARALAMSSPDRTGLRLPTVATDLPYKEGREQWLNYFEREYLGQLLLKHGGNVSAVAAAAGLDRSYVHELIRKHKLK